MADDDQQDAAKQSGGGNGGGEQQQDAAKPEEKSSGGDSSGEQKPDAEKQEGNGAGDVDKKEEPKKPTAKWPWIVAGIVVVVFVTVILLLALLPRAHVKTDDAYVTAHYTMVAPRVGGQVASVHIRDNQGVRAGQLLATLDPRDFQTALQQAEANRESDRARVLQADAQIARQPAMIEQARAQVLSAEARLALARADQQRYTALAETGAGTFQQHQQADAAFRQAQAALVQAQAELVSQQRQLDSLIADRAAAVAQVGRDDAMVAQAKLNLSYTRIYAPIGGVVSQKTVQVGNQVAPGAPILMLVPLEGTFVIANYREIELRHMRRGQAARIHLDSYDVDLAGYVDSIAPATGATFSPIPPNNATGNFTKIVQRLPVKIVVRPRQPLARLLRAGLSVVVTVDTNLDDVVGAACREGVDGDGDGRQDRMHHERCEQR